MPGSRRDEEVQALARDHLIEMLRAACQLAAGNTHRADDLVQTALAGRYVAWRRVRRSGSEAAYLWRIIVNAHLDDVRRPRWWRERYVPKPPGELGPAADDSLAGRVEGETIRAALAKLAAGMRTVIMLRHLLDLSVGQTADLMNCSGGTAKSRAAKAAGRPRGLLTASEGIGQ